MICSFKICYARLSKPILLLWGFKDATCDGEYEKKWLFDKPTSFHFLQNLEEKGVMDIAAGERFFHAIDRKGRLYVWGELNKLLPGIPNEQLGLSPNYEFTTRPLLLNMPRPFVSVSCGKNHSSALDNEGKIWTFLRWDRPFCFKSNLIDGTTPDSTPVQIVCASGYTAALTKSGSVFVWWPMDEDYDRIAKVHARQMAILDQNHQRGVSENDEISCTAWTLTHDPMKLPTNYIKDLKDELIDDVRFDGDIKIVQIAAMDIALLGITNSGHVIILNGMASKEDLKGRLWQNLPVFSYMKGEGEDPDNRKKCVVARGLTFIVYTCDVKPRIYQGHVLEEYRIVKTDVPIWRASGVTAKSISIGMDHVMALTSGGSIYKLNKFIFPGVTVESECLANRIEILGLDKYFCLKATTGMDHAGVLVADLGKRKAE